MGETVQSKRTRYYSPLQTLCSTNLGILQTCQQVGQDSGLGPESIIIHQSNDATPSNTDTHRKLLSLIGHGRRQHLDLSLSLGNLRHQILDMLEVSINCDDDDFSGSIVKPLLQA